MDLIMVDNIDYQIEVVMMHLQDQHQELLHSAKNLLDPKFQNLKYQFYCILDQKMVLQER